MLSDAELVRQFVDDADPAAFAALVTRHVDLVHAAARRQVGCDRALAQEVTQDVFTRLARQASTLTDHPALGAWLYRATRYLALDALRRQARQRRREQEAAAMLHDATERPDKSWDEICPVLDAAMHELSEPDRQVVLWRFFERCTFRQIAQRLGTEENAARMRADRALGKLRRRLERQGVWSTTAALGAVLTAHAVTAAPAGLAVQVSQYCLAILTTSAAGTAVFALLMNTKLILSAAALGLVVTSVWWVAASSPASPSEILPSSRGAAADPVVASVAPVVRPATLARLARGVEERRTAVVAVQSGAADAAAPTPAPLRGRATPLDLMSTFAWACDQADAALMTTLLAFEPAVAEKAQATWLTLPDSVRQQWPSAEHLFGFLMVADALNHPAPPAEVIAQFRVEPAAAPERVRVMYGETTAVAELRPTPEGWSYLVPEVAVDALLAQAIVGEE